MEFKITVALSMHQNGGFLNFYVTMTQQ